MPTSYGFAPGGTSFDIAAAEYVSRRTVLLTKDSATPPDTLDHLVEFVAELSGNQVSRPIKDLMLASHGTSLGAMSLPFDATLDGDSFENVDAIAKAGTVAIPTNVIEPRPLVHDLPFPCRVRVVGCWVGMFRPYLQRLKEALGGAVEVIAPMHEDGFYARADGSAILKGSLRYLLYNFRIYRLTPFATRDEVIDAFAAKYKFFNGGTISRALWKVAIPKGFDTTGNQKIRHDVTLKPAAGGRNSIPVLGEYSRGQDNAGPFPFANGPDAAAPAATRRQFIKTQLATDPRFAATHPLPMFVRDGFTSVDEFVQGYDWLPNALVPNEWNGTRERYWCTIPIWDPANSRRELIYDYFSKDGTVKRIGLEDNHTDLFTLV